MRTARHHRGSWLVVLLAAFALVAAACGSDTADTTTTTTTTEAPVATDAPTTTNAPATTAEPSTTVLATEEATGLAAVCEVGAEEGSFVYWATIEPDNFTRIIEPFLATFPGITIDFLSIREEDGAARMLIDEDDRPDLVYGSQDGLFPIISRDLIDTEFDWSQVDIPDEMLHETNMVRLFVVGLGIAYNTNNATPDDLPATWEELIDAQYAGELVVDPRGNPFDLLSIAWGEEATLDYVTRLKETVNPIVIRGGTAGMTEVIAGGALMTSSGRADSDAELSAEGAPIDMHYMDFVPIRVLYNGMMVGAENTNAAACFAGWLATQEGKDSFESVEFKANDFPPAGVPASATLVAVQSAEDAETTNTVGKLVQEILAPDFEG